MDGIDGSGLADGDGAIIILDNSGTYEGYLYRLEETAVSESSPNVISPDNNAGDKRWRLVNFHAIGFTGPLTGAVTGNVTGDVTGNIDGIVGGSTPAAGSFTTLGASGAATFSKVNAENGSANSVTVQGTLGNMNGNNVFRAIYVDLTNGTNTGSDNYVLGLAINNFTSGDYDASYGIWIGNGWDVGLVSYAPVYVAGTGSSPGVIYVYDTDNDKSVNIAAPSSITTAWTFYLPPEPPSANGSIMTCTTGGVCAFSSELDNMTIGGGTAYTTAGFDSSGNLISITADTAGKVLISGGGSAQDSYTSTPAVKPAEVDGSAHALLNDIQSSNTTVTNYGQAAADVHVMLPTAASGYQILFTVGTARSNHWGACADTNDKIYLIAADGTVTAGSDAGCVIMTAAEVGQSFACWTFKTGSSAYDWQCKAISIGGSTFTTHAHW